MTVSGTVCTRKYSRYPYRDMYTVQYSTVQYSTQETSTHTRHDSFPDLPRILRRFDRDYTEAYNQTMASSNESDSLRDCSLDFETAASFDSENGALWLGAVSVSFLICVLSFRNSRTRPGTQTRDGKRRIRKKEFLGRVGDSYGYAASGKGHIDTWRGTEFPGLVEPLGTRSKKRKDQSIMVYLDYAGAALPAKSQLEASFVNAAILANPHSTGPAASKTLLLMEQATKRVMDHFNCEPGRFAGLANVPDDCDPKDLHPGYEVVFTSGATEALSIVAERFPWTTCQECGSMSTLVYGHNSHTSVVGMRGPALASGGNFQCRPLADICNADAECLDEWSKGDKIIDCHCRNQNLVVVSAECNFGGDRPDINRVVRRCRRESSSRWCTMIDFSKAASTGMVDLKESDPDFCCVSFYKLFGEPTGLGALFVRRSAIGTLMRENDRPRYFGGGSVDVVLPGLDFKVSRQQPSLLASLQNGTVHYRGVVSLIYGFNELQSLGGMAVIKQHSTCLAAEFVRRLRQLRHGNGRPAVVIYGAWAQDDKRDKGPTVAFNCLRSDGSFIGYNEVSKLAELHEPPLQLRTGCFCNPGACQEALGLKDDDIQRIYYTNGHVCGDHIDTVEGTPTGAIRASFGKDSLWEDMDYLLSFLEGTFVNAHDTDTLNDVVKCHPGVVQAEVTELYIFPIKSCAAQRVNGWALENGSGRLVFDREFALIDSSGSAMRLQRYPQMSQIQPRVDTQAMTMTISAPECDDLVVSLLDNASDIKPNGVVQVCGNKCGGQLWGEYESSQWFSNYLGVQCWLARHVKDDNQLSSQRPSNAAFANEESILLISQNAVNRLNRVLERQGQKLVQTKHFRPNIVVSVDDASAFSETSWKLIKHSGSELSFQTVGECARCSMVDVDPTTGMKGKTLRALTEHNQRNGRITFGIFLSRKSTINSDDAIISERDILICK